MSTQPTVEPSELGCSVRRELSHLRGSWWWLLILGILLTAAGTVAIVIPAATAMTSLAAVIFLGIVLMASGASIIVVSFWSGRWGGMLVQLLVGIVYFVAGLTIAELPVRSTEVITLFIASLLIIGGIFRAAAALATRFPHWGWSLVNGIVTCVLGVVIVRHFADASLWLIGTLIGIDIWLHGWSWILLSIALCRLRKAEHHVDHVRT